MEGLKWITKKENFFWFLLFVIVPFIHCDSIIDPDLVPKLIAFSSVLVLVSVFIIIQKNNKSPFSKSTRAFFIITGFYLLTILLSLIKSINMGDALFDFIRLFAPFLFLLVFIVLLRSNKDAVETILKLQNISVIIFSVYGVLQGYSLWNYSNTHHMPFQINYSISSTLGNKNFFAETLLLFLPYSIAAIFYLDSKWKFVSIFSVVLIISELIILKTESTFIGLLIFFAIAFIALLGSSKVIQRFFISPIKIISMVIILVLVSFSITQTEIFKSSVAKINSVHAAIEAKPNEWIDYRNPVNNNSVYARILLWRNSWLLFKENPIVGDGLGNWKIHYLKYGIGGAYYLNAGSTHFEHPHNEYLLMLSERGVLSFVLWLSIIVIGIIYSVRLLRHSIEARSKILITCMLSGIGAFLCISAFGYPLYRSYSPLLFMLMLALIVSMYQSSIYSKWEPNRSIFNKSILVFIICFSLFSIYVLAIRYDGELLMQKAFREQGQKHFERMNKYVSKAESFFFPLDLTSTPLDWYKGFSLYHNNQIDSGFYFFKKAEIRNPYHVELLSDIGACYENKGQHDKSILYFQRALNIIPLFPNALQNISVAYFNNGNIDSAFKYIHLFKSESDFYNQCRLAILKAQIQNLRDTTTNVTFNKFLSIELNNNDSLKKIDAKTDSSTFHLYELLQKEFLTSLK